MTKQTHKNEDAAALKTDSDASARSTEQYSVTGVSKLQGATPSNTAPSNCILRYGVDSLYLSYQGTLLPSREGEIDRLKQQAQSDIKDIASAAQLTVSDTLFEVSDKGSGKYKYVLRSEPFRISLPSSKARRLPVAYCIIASHWLTQHGVYDSAIKLKGIVNSLATDVLEPDISRIDLFVDFVPAFHIDESLGKRFCSRAHELQMYQDLGNVTGYGFGRGGAITARLYNKTVELKKSKKEYLHPIWKEAGWDGKSDVWRLEFQLRREFLREVGILNLVGFAHGVNGLWKYCANEWLRLTNPNPNDQTKSRWPTDPAWQELADIVWNDRNNNLQRTVKNPSLPEDAALFTNTLGGITSYMAREGILNVQEGVFRFLEAATEYHDIKGRASGNSFFTYMTDKVREKARRFGTIDNRIKTKRYQKSIDDNAEAYRNAKDGD